PTIPAVVVVCVVTAITMVGHYAFYTYIAPYALQLGGADAAQVSPLLFIAGIAGAVGLLVTGWLFGRHPTRGLLVAL
ncbi:hypothetical protein ACC691_41570, partial [Rhizobium johnstonii]